jgi:site-specific DNA-cytosine methylase
MLPVIRSQRAVKLTGYCHKHNGVCALRRSKIHIAGTSCVDFSSIGQRGTTAGPTITAFAAWASLALAMEYPIIVHENSPLFQTDLLVAIFGSKYFIDSVVHCPTTFGWPVRRQRRWTVLRHKETVLEAVSSLDNVLQLFNREQGCTWHEFFVAPSEEQLAELRWAATRKGSLWPWPKELKDVKAVHKINNIVLEDLSNESCFRNALARFETETLQGYEKDIGCQDKPQTHVYVCAKSRLKQNTYLFTHNFMYLLNMFVNVRRTVYPEHTSAAQDFRLKRCVYKLNQNPVKGRGIASNPKTLHTLIHNTSIDWSDVHQRWMMSSECLLAQGFPVLNHLVGPYRGTHECCTSFAKQRDGRKFQETKGQAGDSMNVCSVGAMWFHVLYFLERSDTVK